MASTAASYGEKLLELLQNFHNPWMGSKERLEEGILRLRRIDEETYKLVIAPVLGFVLSQLVEQNENIRGRSEAKERTPFDALSVPEISIEDYVERIVKYTPCSKETYFVALIFIDRLLQFNPHFLVTKHNVHRLLITSILVSTKLLDDQTHLNRYYSQVGGISVEELNNLECIFLCLLQYNLSASEDSFERYRFELERISVTDEHISWSPLSSSAPEFSWVHHEEDSFSEQEEEDEQDSENSPQHLMGYQTHHSRLLALDKKLRRSKSLSLEENTIFVPGHRRKRSSSFHIDIQPLIILA